MGVVVMKIFLTIVFVACVYGIACTIDAEVNADEGKEMKKWNIFPYINEFFY